VFANVNFPVGRKPNIFCGRISGIGNFTTCHKCSCSVFYINDALAGITLNNQNMLPSVSTRFNTLRTGDADLRF